MKPSRLLPAALLASALVGAGAVAAIAQDQTPAPEAQSQADRPTMRANVHHKDRGRDHRGGFGAGGRGGSEIFATLFDEVDADGDGSVTQEEIDTFRTAEVARADASGDGALQIEEFDTLYREYTRPRMVDAFQALDADGDGAIGAEEIDRRFGNIVERMDRDDDGALTLQQGGRRG